MGNGVWADRRANGQLDGVRDEEAEGTEKEMTAKRGKGIKRSGLQREREMRETEK